MKKIHITAKIKCECWEEKKAYNALLEACNISGYSILTASKHEFYPFGLTAFVILSESHASIHTFPEEECIYIDVFTCGDKNPMHAIRCFAELMEGDAINVERTVR